MLRLDSHSSDLSVNRTCIEVWIGRAHQSRSRGPHLSIAVADHRMCDQHLIPGTEMFEVLDSAIPTRTVQISENRIKQGVRVERDDFDGVCEYLGVRANDIPRIAQGMTEQVFDVSRVGGIPTSFAQADDVFGDDADLVDAEALGQDEFFEPTKKTPHPALMVGTQGHDPVGEDPKERVVGRPHSTL